MVDLGKVVATNLELFKDMIQLQGLTVDLQNHGSCTIKMSATLAEILMANLLQNAIRHNLPDGFIHIGVWPGKVVISNSGKPLKTDTSNLFKRFYRDSNVEESLGLGLSIVKRITDHYKLKIDYRCEDGVHTVSIFSTP